MSQLHTSIGPLTSTQQGIYVASILLSASASTLCSGYVADAISRRYAILTGGLLNLLGTVLSSSASSFAVLIVARLVTGAGIGQAMSTATVYLVELAPKEVRGVTACLLQTCVVVGITAGYFISFGSHGLRSSMAWRVPFLVQAGVSLPLSVGMLFVPFSPRWLVQRGRVEEARQVLSRFRSVEAVEDEMREIEGGLEEHRGSKTAGLLEMFRRRYVGRSLLGIFLMAAQQLTGVSVLFSISFLFAAYVSPSTSLEKKIYAFHKPFRGFNVQSDRCNPLLRTDSLPASRLQLGALIIPRVRCQRYRHARRHRSSANMGRPLGPP